MKRKEWICLLLIAVCLGVLVCYQTMANLRADNTAPEIVFSDQLTAIFASGFTGETAELTSFFVKVTFAYVIFTSTAGILDAYLEQEKAAYAYVDWAEVPHPQVKFCIYTPRKGIFNVTADSEDGQFFSWLERDVNQRGGGSITALNSLPGMVEVQVANTSKGLAARELARRLGRKTLICAGDAVNDLSMLKEADIAFVSADCDERIRDLGFRKAAACAEGTIADVIRQLAEEH